MLKQSKPSYSLPPKYNTFRNASKRVYRNSSRKINSKPNCNSVASVSGASISHDYQNSVRKYNQSMERFRKDLHNNGFCINSEHFSSVSEMSLNMNSASQRNFVMSQGGTQLIKNRGLFGNKFNTSGKAKSPRRPRPRRQNTFDSSKFSSLSKDIARNMILEDSQEFGDPKIQSHIHNSGEPMNWADSHKRKKKSKTTEFKKNQLRDILGRNKKRPSTLRVSPFHFGGSDYKGTDFRSGKQRKIGKKPGLTSQPKPREYKKYQTGNTKKQFKKNPNLSMPGKRKVIHVGNRKYTFVSAHSRSKSLFTGLYNKGKGNTTKKTPSKLTEKKNRQIQIGNRFLSRKMKKRGLYGDLKQMWDGRQKRGAKREDRLFRFNTWRERRERTQLNQKEERELLQRLLINLEKQENVQDTQNNLTTANKNILDAIDFSIKVIGQSYQSSVSTLQVH